MPITYYDKKKLFQLETAHTTYLIGLSPEGYVGHVYYGEKLEHPGDNYLLRMEEPPFTPEKNWRDKASFLDSFPTEYPTSGAGDFREPCLAVDNELGMNGCELFYHSHQIYRGKKALAGLPSSFGREEEVTTLEILCKDEVLGLDVTLTYSVFADCDIITRSQIITNQGDQDYKLNAAYSACLDFDDENWEMLTLCGAWARERHIVRRPVEYGKQNASSIRGQSSAQENPFFALLSPGTNQKQGKVYAMNLVYSGNFLAQAEKSSFASIRMVIGIHRQGFRWTLRPGESFTTPEAVLTFSANGLGCMTRNFHRFYRGHLIRSPYNHTKRPILINNWEATYFQFDTEKLLSIARTAKSHGIEMLVMDDGWFGKRSSDNSSLGDWVVNEEKLQGGLKYLVDQVNALGMKFGIWFEPEMVSPDSDLYRAHPDWAIQIPGRVPTQIREQYVLDISRPEVRDEIFRMMSEVLHSANVEYVKWDMNRQLTDLGSYALTKETQGELYHRFVLGMYELQERLVTEFPDLLLENCSSGGARFDPGMLYYSPQIWCSDDTDAIERLAIQEGTAMVYPLSSMGAHVSDCPNHAVGRSTPFATRGHVALAGTFGYELDVTKISQEEREMIPEQCQMYHKYNDLVREGEYYRIASFSENHSHDCWAVASEDHSEVLVTYIQVLTSVNVHSRKLYLDGFDPDRIYLLEETGVLYSGEMLMKAGFLIPQLRGDFQSRLYHFIAQ